MQQLGFKVGDKVTIDSPSMGKFHKAQGTVIDVITSVMYPYRVSTGKSDAVFLDEELSYTSVIRKRKCR